MAGRTERVQSNEIESRVWDLLFEAEVARDWLSQVGKRSAKLHKNGMKNTVFVQEHEPLLLDLQNITNAITEADRALNPIAAMIEQRLSGEQ